MSCDIPRFIEILDLARLAYELGGDDLTKPRMVVRDFPGAEPRRKHGPGRIIVRLEKKAISRQNLFQFSFLSKHERKLLVAAYDQGIADSFQELETARRLEFANRRYDHAQGS